MASFDVPKTSIILTWNHDGGSNRHANASFRYSETGGLLSKRGTAEKTVTDAAYRAASGQTHDETLQAEIEAYFNNKYPGGPHTVNFT